MKQPIYTLKNALHEAYDEFYRLVLFNVLWLLVSLPVVTIPPALAGLYYATNQLAHKEDPNWRTFFKGFRSYFWMSWRWAAINILTIFLLLLNIYFYSLLNQSWARLLEGIFLGLLIIWLLLQLFTFPLLLEQDDQRFRTALRNSLVLYLRAFRLSLSLLILLLIVALISIVTVLPWILITIALAAFLVNWILLQVLEDLRAVPLSTR